MSTLNERMKEVRKHFGMSQKEFANNLNISQAHVSNIEQGKDNPSSSLVKLTCVIFHVSEEWLSHGKGEFATDTDMFPQLESAALTILALEQLAQLLRTTSTIKSSYYSCAISSFSSTLVGDGLSESNMYNYLEYASNHFMELERFLSMLQRLLLNQPIDKSELSRINSTIKDYLAKLPSDLLDLVSVYAQQALDNGNLDIHDHAHMLKDLGCKRGVLSHSPVQKSSPGRSQTA